MDPLPTNSAVAPIRVGILGGAGYTGGELLRILLAHPRVVVAAVSSSTFPGQPLHAAHPHLRGRSRLAFVPELEPRGLDAVFLAGSHGEAMARVPALLQARPDLRLVDLSGDFRLRDAALYPLWYQRVHSAPALLADFVYGQPELDRAAVARARRIANPGCFATAVELALGPLARAGVAGTARVVAVTGSSGSGAKPSSTTHHPTRAANVHAYKPLAHQHVPEIEQFLDRLAGKPSLDVALVPVSGPLVRGIYAVCQLDLPAGWDIARVTGCFRSAFEGCAFVHLLDDAPDLNAVAGSNDVHISLSVRDGQLAVISALDNLVKGASGQAVQNLNVMMGWDEAEGLRFSAVYP